MLPEGSNLPYMSIILATTAAASIASTAVVHWQDAAAAFGGLQQLWDTAVDAVGPSDSPISGANPLFELVYTSFCSTDLVLLIELVALQTVSSTEAALIYSLEPVSVHRLCRRVCYLGSMWFCCERRLLSAQHKGLNKGIHRLTLPVTQLLTQRVGVVGSHADLLSTGGLPAGIRDTQLGQHTSKVDLGLLRTRGS